MTLENRYNHWSARGVVALHPFEPKDLPWFNEVRNHPDTAGYLHDSRVYSLEETKDWFEREKPLYWWVEYTRKPIGYIRTSNVNYEDGSITVGLDIDPKFRGSGLAFKVYEELFDFLRSRLFTRVNLEVLQSNERALHIYRKLGFVETGSTPHNGDVSIAMTLELPKLKAVKVIPVYFGDRRSWPKYQNDSHHVHGLLEYVIAKEKELDPGIDCDTVFVINCISDTDTVTEKDWASKCYELVKGLDGTNTKRGVIKVVERENNGVSFASYDHAFHEFRDLYDVWFFCEDDQVIVADNVISAALPALRNLAEPCGFVATVGLASTPKPHAHGGCGITTRGVLDEVLKEAQNVSFKKEQHASISWFHRNGRAHDFPKATSPFDYLGRPHLPCYFPSEGTGLGCGNKEIEILGEVSFTWCISYAGFSLTNHLLEKINVNWKNAGHDKHVPGLWFGVLRNCHGEAVRMVPYTEDMDTAMP